MCKVRHYLQEIFEGWRHSCRVADPALDDALDEGVNVVGEEGRLSSEQLVQNNARGPQVNLQAEGYERRKVSTSCKAIVLLQQLTRDIIC